MAQKVGAVETAADFFRRAGETSGSRLANLMDRVPDRGSNEEDELSSPPP